MSEDIINNASLMDFSAALNLCKLGCKISRVGWNGKDQYVVFQKGYPDGIAINGNTAEATGIPQGTICIFEPYLMLRNVQGHFVPWLATQSDLLNEDWFVLTVEEDSE